MYGGIIIWREEFSGDPSGPPPHNKDDYIFFNLKFILNVLVYRTCVSKKIHISSLRMAGGASGQRFGSGRSGNASMALARSKLKHRCLACSATQRGCDIGRHYRNNTDWNLVRKMRKCVGHEALEGLKSRADKHSLYIFLNNFND